METLSDPAQWNPTRRATLYRGRTVPRLPVDVVGKTNQELGLPRIEFEWPPKRSAELDRPPKEPFLRYGWRSVIGAIGRLFISLGMLLFGFVGYQLWGTGLQTAASQKALAKEFASKQRAPLPRPTTTVTVAPATTLAPVDGSAAPTTAATTTTLPQPEPLEIPEADEVFAQLAIPRINMKANNILSGVSVDDLRKGVGHFRNTPLPGQKGNVALAGHRTTYGAPFGDLDKLQSGDPITFTNTLGEQFVYKVTSQTVVAPDDTTVLAPTEVPSLTLVTCDPKYTSTSRLIIRAELDVAASTPGPLRDPTPPSAGKPEPLPDGSAPTTIESTIAPVSTVAGSPSTATPTTVATSTTTVSASEESEEDLNGALTLGWFSDKTAPPQVALWGAICGVIGLGAWLISRRLHRNMIGFLIGIFPFLIALYFFYENANRLLPPGL
jgi:sortase A